MYRNSTPEFRGRPLYRVCATCGRNDHKVAVFTPTKANRPFGQEHHNVHGYCTSCFADDYDAFATATASGLIRIVYDNRGKVAKAKYPTPKRGATRAVYATDHALRTVRVSYPLTEGDALELWEALDDRRRNGGLPAVKFVEVRAARPSSGLDRDERYANAPFEPGLVK